jgi:1,4-alpha-glucan branching enzyme
MIKQFGSRITGPNQVTFNVWAPLAIQVDVVGEFNSWTANHPALRNGFFEITHEDYSNNILAFKRWNNEGDVLLVVINAGDNTFTDHSYGLNTRQNGQWQQILCSQDSEFGGWHGAGNAYYDPYNHDDNRIYINIPQWSVLVFRLL